jgi:hypothetical protein
MSASLRLVFFDDPVDVRQIDADGPIALARQPAPHWQPFARALHGRSEWFSQTQPRPGQIGNFVQSKSSPATM